MSRITLSLTARIFLAIAATALLVVAVMGLLIASSMRDGFSRYLLQGEINRFDDLVLALSELHAADPTSWTQFRSDPRLWRAFVGDNFRPAGRPLRRPEAGQGPPAPRRGDPLQVSARLFLLDAQGSPIVVGADSGKASVLRPILTLDGQTVIGQLGLTTPEHAVEGIDAFFIRGQYQSLLVASVLGFGISAAVALLLARGILAPIKALEAGARTLSRGKYSMRIPTVRTDELGDLIGHYNVLAQNLEAAEAAERQWISNTSHELQTPLAVLRAQIEALQDGVREPDARTLAEMHGAVMRLSQLVHDVKLLSFAREGRLLAALAPTDLAEIAQDAAGSMAVRAGQAGLELTCHFDAPLVASCEAGRIRQVVDNILENALRYTAAPGRIVVGGARQGGVVTISVDDTAPVPVPDSLPHLFERFYRAEKSRSRADGGAGLGLSICEAIVRAHGGTITAVPSAMGGLRVAFSLPEAGAA
ncbi:MAG: ATP-binding protein [Paracoccaceae bacterium]